MSCLEGTLYTTVGVDIVEISVICSDTVDALHGCSTAKSMVVIGNFMFPVKTAIDRADILFLVIRHFWDCTVHQ